MMDLLEELGMHAGASPEIFAYASQLRRNMTNQERKNKQETKRTHQETERIPKKKKMFDSSNQSEKKRKDQKWKTRKLGFSFNSQYQE